jgi:hypothetical protein
MKRKQMRRLSFAISLSCILLLGAAERASASVRHCDSRITAGFEFGYSNNDKLIVVPQSDIENIVQSSSGFVITHVKGRGECKWGYWNNCRRNAKKAILLCARGLWATRWSFSLPPLVCNTRETSRPPNGWITRWFNAYTRPRYVGDIKDTIAQGTCCYRNRYIKEMTLQIKINVFGGKRCQHSEIYSNHYFIDCVAARRRGVCSGVGRPDVILLPGN